jgi:uncharacterized membrane protein YdjX (TVP38/TMEM64 family)
LTPPPESTSRLRPLVGVAAIVALIIVSARFTPALLHAIGRIRSLGPAAPAVFLAVYIAAVVALVPASWLTLVAGAVFGLAKGAALAFIGAALGSTVAFLLGRFAFRTAVARQLERMPRLAAVDAAVSREGLWVVLLLRLSPLVPFNLLNYALGLTTLPTAHFVAASLGMLPATFLYAYAGTLAGEALALAGEATVPKTPSYYVILVAGLAATAAATVAVARAASRALRDV